MFDPGNIQGRPTPILYIQNEFKIKTFGVSPNIKNGISKIVYNRVVLNGSETEEENLSVSNSISELTYKPTILISDSEGQENADTSNGISHLSYDRRITNGSNQIESVTVENGISALEYSQVIFNGAQTDEEAATIQQTISELNYTQL